MKINYTIKPLKDRDLIYRFLYQIPDSEIRSKAINNYRTLGPVYLVPSVEITNAAQALKEAFVWANSVEGGFFWAQEFGKLFKN